MGSCLTPKRRILLLVVILNTISKSILLIVESACSVVVTWEAIHPKSGLDVTYWLFNGKKFI